MSTCFNWKFLPNASTRSCCVYALCSTYHGSTLTTFITYFATMFLCSLLRSFCGTCCLKTQLRWTGVSPRERCPTQSTPPLATDVGVWPGGRTKTILEVDAIRHGGTRIISLTGISATVRLRSRGIVGKGMQDRPPKLEHIRRVVDMSPVQAQHSNSGWLRLFKAGIQAPLPGSGFHRRKKPEKNLHSLTR